MPLSERSDIGCVIPQSSPAIYNIGHWAWELSSLPPYWRHAFRYIDEIWTVSPYTTQTFRRLTDKPRLLRSTAGAS